MRLTFILILLISPLHFAQTGAFNFHSPENIKTFADYLFFEKDYLRANLEYQKLENIVDDDTLNFKIGLGYLYIGDHLNSIKKLSEITPASTFFDDAKLQVLKAFFLTEDNTAFRSFYLESFSNKTNNYQSNEKKLFNFSYLFTDDDLPASEEFLNPFNRDEKEKVTSFYNWKNEPPKKNPTLAGIISAVIPGSGKMYVGEWGDGIMALITTGLFAFLAYDNFRADHNTRAWIFTGLGAFFYAGNVYGSVAAAQIYNAKIAFEFEDGLNLYLEQKNYFTPEYNFCE
jgi:hypothetical protein